MFAELEKVMAAANKDGTYLEALAGNVTGKKSERGSKKTAMILKRFYHFSSDFAPFAALSRFWKQASPEERPLLAFVYAASQDSLLAQSAEKVETISPGERVSVQSLEEQIEQYHPGRYSPITRYSIAKNIASSWKQAGFIKGKIKNIRVEPVITARVTVFAFLLAYLEGRRGEFIWSAPSVKALCLPETRLRMMALEGARQGLIQYQHSGNVTNLSFINLIDSLKNHGNEN